MGPVSIDVDKEGSVGGGMFVVERGKMYTGLPM